MRTTLRIDDQLLAEAKRRAVDRGTTLTQVVEDALRDSLARREPLEWKPLPKGGEGGVFPGVDLDDSRALRDIMDGL